MPYGMSDFHFICMLCVVRCQLRVALCEQVAAARGTRLGFLRCPCPWRSSGRPPGFSRFCCLALMCAACGCGKPKMVITQQVRRAWRTDFDTSRQWQEAADNPQHGSSLYDQRSRQHHVAETHCAHGRDKDRTRRSVDRATVGARQPLRHARSIRTLLLPWKYG